MSLNNAGDYRKIVPVDEDAAKQIRQIAFDHMKNGYGVSDGEDISAFIRSYTMSLAPEKRLSGFKINLGSFVHRGYGSANI